MRVVIGFFKAVFFVIYKGVVIVVRMFTTGDPVQEVPPEQREKQREPEKDDDINYDLPDAIEGESLPDDR
jgi:hypothetical protein